MRRAAEVAALVALVPLLTGFSVLEKRDPEIEAGNAALKAGKAEDALAHYDKAVKKLAADAGAHFDRGAALYALSRFDEAGQEFLKATEAKDAALKEGAFYNLGNAFFKKEKFKEAVAAYTRALGLRPDDKQAKWNLEIALKQAAGKGPEGQRQEEGRPEEQGRQGPEAVEGRPEEGRQVQAGRQEAGPGQERPEEDRTTRRRTSRSSSPSRSRPTTGNRPRRCWTTWNAARRTSRRNARACAPCAARRRSATGEKRVLALVCAPARRAGRRRRWAPRSARRWTGRRSRPASRSCIR